ncbi:MAG: hypothetical protein HQ559_00015 [Lentisphaerae bacterium]|nr:hypothetical protein [Lentisphaerota bacterium]
MTRLRPITVAMLLVLAPVFAGAQEKKLVFLGFTLGCDKIDAEQTADASPRMTRKRTPRSETSTPWTRTLYTGNLTFRKAITTELVFHEKRLYGIKIRLRESPSRRPLALFHAIREALSRKYGQFDDPAPVSEKETVSRLSAAVAKRKGMYIEVASLAGSFVEIRAYHNTTRNRIIGEERKKVIEDDLIDIDVF